MKCFLSGLLCLLLTGAASAATDTAAPVEVQASMMLDGSIIVAPDGHVAGYAIDDADEVPPVVRKLLTQAIPSWSFEPVVRDGKAVEAKSAMALRIVAKPRDDGKVSIGVAGARFYSDGASSDVVTYRHKRPPIYPRSAGMDGASATVFVLLRVNRQGKVDDATATQVNLKTRGSAAQMDQWRKSFADASLTAARRWTFNMPTSGNSAQYTFVQVAVSFLMVRDMKAFERHMYGKWQPYIPGPRQPVPWVDASSIANGSDVMPADGLVTLGQGGLHLTTRLGG
ncbi:MAG TPA: energy transducer TonB [Rhodanobacteraceae bacterium]|nr:energy transducer TonB [Rhodanobacteraceae bacterium]